METLETHATDGVLLVRLTRPRRRNAINAAMAARLQRSTVHHQRPITDVSVRENVVMPRPPPAGS